MKTYSTAHILQDQAFTIDPVEVKAILLGILTLIDFVEFTHYVHGENSYNIGIIFG